MKPVVYSDRARIDLDEIWEYTVDRWGRDQARTYLASIEESCRAAAEGRMIGRLIPVGMRTYLRVRCRSHFIYGREAHGGFFVVRIRHERMDFPFDHDPDN